MFCEIEQWVVTNHQTVRGHNHHSCWDVSTEPLTEGRLDQILTSKQVNIHILNTAVSQFCDCSMMLICISMVLSRQWALVLLQRSNVFHNLAYLPLQFSHLIARYTLWWTTCQRRPGQKSNPWSVDCKYKADLGTRWQEFFVEIW